MDPVVHQEASGTGPETLLAPGRLATAGQRSHVVSLGLVPLHPVRGQKPVQGLPGGGVVLGGSQDRVWNLGERLGMRLVNYKSINS